MALSLALCAVLALAPQAEGARSDAPVRPPAAPASDPAVDAYRKGDLETARVLWLARLESADAPAERGRVLYNLGNAAFRSGDLPRAVGWYTAALAYRPRDGDTWANLEFARSEAGFEPADRGDLSATVQRLLSSWTLAESEWAVLGATALWTLVLLMEAVRGGRVWRRLGWIGFALVAASLVPWLYNLGRSDRARVLVVAAQAVPVRSEPRRDAAQIGRAEPGEIVLATDELPDWIEVRGEGVEGWIERESAFDLRR